MQAGHLRHFVGQVFTQLITDDSMPPVLGTMLVTEIETATRECRQLLETDLRTLGYAPAYARHSSEQIILKPVAFSLMMRLRTEGLGALFPQPYLENPIEFVRWEPREARAARIYLLYQTEALAITAYMFDQVMDGKNDAVTAELGQISSTVIDDEIELARTLLADNPEFFHSRLKRVVALSYVRRDFDTSRPEQDDDILEALHREGLSAYLLVARLAVVLRDAGLHLDETTQTVSTLADVLCYELMADVGHRNIQTPDWALVPPADFPDMALARYPEQQISADEAVALAVCRNQGFFMVSVLHMVLSQSEIWLRDTRFSLAFNPEHAPVVDLLRANPELFMLVRLYEVLVRLSDDVGDYYTDAANDEVNILSESQTAWMTFMRHCADIDRFFDETFVGWSGLTPAVARIKGQAANPDTKQVIYLLVNLLNRAHQFYAADYATPALMTLLDIMYCIVQGAVVIGTATNDAAFHQTTRDVTAAAD